MIVRDIETGRNMLLLVTMIPTLQQLLSPVKSSVNPFFSKEKMCGLLLLSIGSAAEASAAQSIYSGPMGAGRVEFVTASDSKYYFPTVIGAGQQISVDPTALNLAFQKFVIQTGALAISDTRSITTGFGSTKNYGIAVNFDSYSISVSDGGGLHALIPGNGGSYTISDTGSGNYVTPAYTFSLTGTYQISGPTQTVTGTFSVPVTGYSYMIVPDTLNTNGFPDQLALSHSNNQFHTYMNVSGDGLTDTELFSRTVDGEQVGWALEYIHLSAQFGTLTSGVLAVPEVSGTMLAAIAVTGSALRRKRRRN